MSWRESDEKAQVQEQLIRSAHCLVEEVMKLESGDKKIAKRIDSRYKRAAAAAAEFLIRQFQNAE